MKVSYITFWAGLTTTFLLLSACGDGSDRSQGSQKSHDRFSGSAYQAAKDSNDLTGTWIVLTNFQEVESYNSWHQQSSTETNYQYRSILKITDNGDGSGIILKCGEPERPIQIAGNKMLDEGLTYDITDNQHLSWETVNFQFNAVKISNLVEPNLGEINQFNFIFNNETIIENTEEKISCFTEERNSISGNYSNAEGDISEYDSWSDWHTSTMIMTSDGSFDGLYVFLNESYQEEGDIIDHQKWMSIVEIEPNRLPHYSDKDTSIHTISSEPNSITGSFEFIDAYLPEIQINGKINIQLP